MLRTGNKLPILTVLNLPCFGQDSITQGGALFISQGGIASLKNCEFYENTAVWGGAVSVYNHARFECEQCLFYGNVAVRSSFHTLK